MRRSDIFVCIAILPPILTIHFKVLKWHNTIFAHAFADATQRAHKDYKKTKQTSCHYQHYPTPALFALFSHMIEPNAFLVLVVYFKDMLQKVTMQKTQQLSPFSLLPNLVKCSACAVARKKW